MPRWSAPPSASARVLGHPINGWPSTSVSISTCMRRRVNEMLIHKPFSEISGGDLGWLNAKHHFALGSYGNPSHLPLGELYVLNDDQIAAYSGFPHHGHTDVEIVSYVRSGTLTHEDGLGNKGHLHAGDVQVMSAGTGIRHAEYNEGDDPIH